MAETYCGRRGRYVDSPARLARITILTPSQRLPYGNSPNNKGLRLNRAKLYGVLSGSLD